MAIFGKNRAELGRLIMFFMGEVGVPLAIKESALADVLSQPYWAAKNQTIFIKQCKATYFYFPHAGAGKF
ncbi:hypothetical protein [Polynucleobacter antarcticus]|uniref:Uncharacterized protein n=1 Tax=Polynucleobacter antarcticus TaxID=1743162 RepID=A0A6M9PUJ0_9BURK|nr:hypothetical protein [Polynucleobacter antarcticus]QKM63512.1 hypothetical protein DCO16_10960 [Polynucleobacter antarcticus]